MEDSLGFTEGAKQFYSSFMVFPFDRNFSDCYFLDIS